MKKAGYKVGSGRPVLLLVCNAARGDLSNTRYGSFASRLSRLLGGAPVRGNEGNVHTTTGGFSWWPSYSYSGDGQWRTYP